MDMNFIEFWKYAFSAMPFLWIFPISIGIGLVIEGGDLYKTCKKLKDVERANIKRSE